MPLVDLSHVIEHEMVSYPGLPGPRIGEHMSFEASREHYAAGTEFAIGQIGMVANTGTYLDTPAHRFRDGQDLSGLALERCADLPAVVVDADGEIGPAATSGTDVAGCAVLLRTGWDRHWRTEHYGDAAHPYLSADGAEALIERGAVLVGIDSVNIDHTAGGAHPAAGGRDLDRRAPDRARCASGHRCTVHRRTAGRPRPRDLPGPGVRRGPLTGRGPVDPDPRSGSAPPRRARC